MLDITLFDQNFLSRVTVLYAVKLQEYNCHYFRLSGVRIYVLHLKERICQYIVKLCEFNIIV